MSKFQNLKAGSVVKICLSANTKHTAAMKHYEAVVIDPRQYDAIVYIPNVSFDDFVKSSCSGYLYRGTSIGISHATNFKKITGRNAVNSDVFNAPDYTSDSSYAWIEELLLCPIAALKAGKIKAIPNV